MDKLDAFKEFVKNNPELIKHVKSNEMTWQKFYELYDLYGNEISVWKPYLGVSEAVRTEKGIAAAATSAIGINDVINWVKTVDINTIQSGINSVQRVVGVLQDFTTKDKTEAPKEEYKPRPLYKSFED